MKSELVNFNKVLNSIIQQNVTAKLDGQDIPVKQDDKGNAQISVQIPITQQAQEQVIDPIIEDLKVQLRQILNKQVQVSRAARHYASCSPKEDLPKVMYNYGFAQGKRNILKYILNKLDNKG